MCRKPCLTPRSASAKPCQLAGSALTRLLRGVPVSSARYTSASPLFSSMFMMPVSPGCPVCIDKADVGFGGLYLFTRHTTSTTVILFLFCMHALPLQYSAPPHHHPQTTTSTSLPLPSPPPPKHTLTHTHNRYNYWLSSIWRDAREWDLSDAYLGVDIHLLSIYIYYTYKGSFYSLHYIVFRKWGIM